MQEVSMLKLNSLLVLAVTAIAASQWPAPATAALVRNGVVDQGLSPTGPNASFMTLRAVRLALPDGTELTFH
jgi:hypothetical protein